MRNQIPQQVQADKRLEATHQKLAIIKIRVKIIPQLMSISVRLILINSKINSKIQFYLQQLHHLDQKLSKSRKI